VQSTSEGDTEEVHVAFLNHVLIHSQFFLVVQWHAATSGDNQGDIAMDIDTLRQAIISGVTRSSYGLHGDTSPVAMSSITYDPPTFVLWRSIPSSLETMMYLPSRPCLTLAVGFSSSSSSTACLRWTTLVWLLWTCSSFAPGRLHDKGCLFIQPCNRCLRLTLMSMLLHQGTMKGIAMDIDTLTRANEVVGLDEMVQQPPFYIGRRHTLPPLDAFCH